MVIKRDWFIGGLEFNAFDRPRCIVVALFNHDALFLRVFYVPRQFAILWLFLDFVKIVRAHEKSLYPIVILSYSPHRSPIYGSKILLPLPHFANL
jgi:hypothetical protein